MISVCVVALGMERGVLRYSLDSVALNAPEWIPNDE